MSKYTTEVRFICETYAQLDKSEGYQSINGIIEKARDKVFNFDFPIYDESYRSVLESKILKHYYTREIGFETVGLWEHFLDMKMNEIMPYYNQLYKSALLDFNPLYDVDYTTTSNRGIKSNENSTNHNTRTDNLKEVTNLDNTRTYNLDENTTETDTRTDNLKEQNTNNNTRTDNLSSKYDDKSGTEYGHIIDTTNTTDADNSDRYSETPQGSLQGLQELTYLTNARMKTEASNETGKESHSGLDSSYDGSTTLNTGTQKNEGSYTKDNTGTQENKINKDKSNTGTQNENGARNKNNTGTQDNNGNGTKDFNSTDEYLEHVAGKRSTASYSELINEYRKTFLNIDMMIINDLSNLFMNIW